MVAISRLFDQAAKPVADDFADAAPDDSTAEDAFRMVLRWIGEDPERDGLRETPKRW